MYLAIDIGGTKTLLAVFDRSGRLISTHKFPTPPQYEDFKHTLKETIIDQLGKYKFTHCCCAVPGRVDRKSGIAVGFGNLGWRNVPIKKDVEAIIKAPVLIENDANLAGLSEAHLVLDTYKKVLYITISTGIGNGVIVNGVIDPNLADSEPGHMILEHEGQIKRWENFASGKAIVSRFGKKASEINDPETWRLISKDIAYGLIDVIATLQPEVVIIGGGVGTHFRKYGIFLKQELKKYENSLVTIPPILGAKHAEEAVIYGCYQLIKQKA